MKNAKHENAKSAVEPPLIVGDFFTIGLIF